MGNDAWRIIRATDPQQLIDHAALFDGPVTPAGAQDFLDRPGQVLLLAIDTTGRGLGFVSGVEMSHPDKRPELFVNELGVAAEARRRGVARALLAAVRATAVQRGCRGMWTATEHDNDAALATYRSLGATVDSGVVLIAWDDLTDSAG